MVKSDNSPSTRYDEFLQLVLLILEIIKTKVQIVYLLLAIGVMLLGLGSV